MRAGFDLCSDVAAHTKGSWDVSAPTPVCVTSACGSCTCQGWQEAGRSHCWASAVPSQSPRGARQQVLPVALTGRSQIGDSTARSVTREAERSVLEQKERRLGQGDGSRRGDFSHSAVCVLRAAPSDAAECARTSAHLAPRHLCGPGVAGAQRLQALLHLAPGCRAAWPVPPSRGSPSWQSLPC